MSHASTGIGHVTGIPGDHMAVEVMDGLASRGSAVHADVVAIRCMISFDELPGQPNGVLQVGFLHAGQLEVILSQRFADDQGVAGRYRERISDQEKMFGPTDVSVLRDVKEVLDAHGDKGVIGVLTN